MDKLFSPRKYYRARLYWTLVASLLVHGCLIGISAVWPQNKTFELPPITNEVYLEAGDPEVRELVVADTPPPDMPTPPPEETPMPDTPPPTEEPDMTEPEKPTPPPKPATAKASKPVPANAKHGPVAVEGVVGGNPQGTKSTGTPGRGGAWHCSSKPPYPYQARAAHVTGSGTVRVTTDGSGRVISAEIVQSVGNGILDANTKSFAKSNWSGPPNASTVVPITYQLK